MSPTVNEDEVGPGEGWELFRQGVERFGGERSVVSWVCYLGDGDFEDTGLNWYLYGLLSLALV